MRVLCFLSFIALLIFSVGEARRKWSLTEARRKLSELAATPRVTSFFPKKVHHLVVLQHGLGGNASDWSFFAETLEKLNTGLRWIKSGWNDKPNGTLVSGKAENIQITFWAPTYNSEAGIDIVGQQLADDILKRRDEYWQNGEPIKYLSAIGHSMGGLFLRYAFKSLNERGAISHGRSASLLPSNKMQFRNFFTLATPHLSVWRPNDSFGGFLFNLVARVMPEPSPQQVSLNDAEFRVGADSARQPLLYRMATEEAFMKPLSFFRRGVLYSNVFGDTQVWYESGAIRTHNPYMGRGSVRPQRHAPFTHMANNGCRTSNHSVPVKLPYWSSRHPARRGKAVAHMHKTLNSIVFGKSGWERCDVNIDGSLATPFREHFSHWLILGIEKGMWKVEDPAMHVMKNLILGDDTIKNSRHRFQVMMEASRNHVDSFDSR